MRRVHGSTRVHSLTGGSSARMRRELPALLAGPPQPHPGQIVNPMASHPTVPAARKMARLKVMGPVEALPAASACNQSPFDQ
jgi:hypothetical protein